MTLTEIRPTRSYAVAAAGAVLSTAVVVWAIMFFAGWKSVPVDMVGLHYTGGPFDGQFYQQTVAPGTPARFYGLLDQVALLPVTTRDYLISKNPKEDFRGGVDFIAAQSKEGVIFEWETATYFKLNTEPDTLRAFYEQVCLRYGCTRPEGWEQLINHVFRQQIENIVQV